MTITVEVKPSDPEATYRRRAIAQRRVGVGAKCACGEARPEALKRQKNRVICLSCIRKEKGMKTTDGHHHAMKANSPDTTPIPVNDHVAELNTAQQDWPKRTRENPDGSPLLSAAGCVRGFIDTIVNLINRVLGWIPKMLETLDAFLTDALGPKWWKGTEIAQFAPQGA